MKVLFRTVRRPVPALALALAAALALAGGAAQAAPTAQVEPKSLDLGMIDEGGSYERYLELKNVGDGVLILEDVKTSCGCTAAAVDGDVELAAGESQKIRVTFNSRNMDGGVSKKITVMTNDPDRGQIQVVLKADVHRPIKWTPRYLSFDRVGLSEPVAETITFETDLNLDARIEEAYVQGGLRKPKKTHLFDVDVSDRRTGEERNAYDLTVKMRDRRKPQRISETLVIITNLADQDTVRVPIRGEIIGRIRFTPSYAVMAMVDPGQETTRDVVVSTSEGTFRIQSATVPNSPVEVELLPEADGARTTLRLHYIGEEAGANGVRQLEIKTDDPNQALIEIPVRYQTRAPAPKSAATTKGPGG